MGAVVGLVCATEGAALADAAAAGVALAVAAAGVVAAAAGVVVAAAAAAGVAVALGAAEVAGVVLAVAGEGVVWAAAGVALADVSSAGAFFISFLLGCSFFGAGVIALVAGCSPEAFVSGAAGFGAFLSGFGAAGSFTAGASGFGAAGSFTAGASGFGAAGSFTAGAFLSGFLPGACDSSGVGCWAVTAPASASEATISKLVNFFILLCVGRRCGRSIQRRGVFCPARSTDRVTIVVRASAPIRFPPPADNRSIRGIACPPSDLRPPPLLVPKLCLVTQLSSKLRFACVSTPTLLGPLVSQLPLTKKQLDDLDWLAAEREARSVRAIGTWIAP